MSLHYYRETAAYLFVAAATLAIVPILFLSMDRTLVVRMSGAVLDFVSML